MTGLAILSGSYFVGSSIKNQGWTTDEYYHIQWAQDLYESGEDGRSDYFDDSKTPVAISYSFSRKLFSSLVTERLSEVQDRFATRLPVFFWYWLTLLLVFCLAKGVGVSTNAALFSVAFCALEPNIIAHNSVATVDGAFVAVFIIYLLTMIRYNAKPSLLTVLGIGAVLALSLATKFSGVLLFIPTGILILAKLKTRGYFTIVADTLVLIASLCTLTCLLYFFNNVGESLAEIAFVSKPFKSVQALLPSLALPLPSSLLTGIDICFHKDANQVLKVIMLGNWYQEGTSLYFLVHWLFKTPIIMIALQICGLFYVCKKWNSNWSIVTSISLLFFIYFSFMFKTQIGYRYLLFLVPIAMIAAGVSVAEIFSGAKYRGPILVAVVVALLIDMLPYHNNSLAYTNQMVYPKHDVYKYIADSNVDWGQHKTTVKKLPLLQAAPFRLSPPTLLPGKNVFSVNDLAGVDGDYSKMGWIRKNVPAIDHYQYSHIVLNLDDELYLRYLDDNRKLETRHDNSSCSNPIELTRSAIKKSFKGNISVCVDSNNNKFLKATGWGFTVGRLSDEGICQGVYSPTFAIHVFKIDRRLFNFCLWSRDRTEVDLSVFTSFKELNESFVLTGFNK